MSVQRVLADRLRALFPEDWSSPPGSRGRSWQLGAGALAGMVAAALLGGVSAGWVLAGAALGLAAVLAGARLARDESATAPRVVAFALPAQAVLGLLPLAAYGGVLPRPEDAAFSWLDLALPTLAAALLAGLRHSLARRVEDRRAPRQRGLRLGRWGPTLALLMPLALVVWLDVWMPAPYSTGILYLVPVFLAVRAAGPASGLVIALLSAEVHGVVRGLTYAGGLSVPLSALESGITLLGLAAAGILSRDIELQTQAARTDPLTGLLNRGALLERLGQHLGRRGRSIPPLSLAYLDLDGFKHINDERGHATGDQVLKVVAEVLRHSVRNQDAVARMGGDEFAVLLVSADAEDARLAMDRLRRDVESEMHAHDWDVTCSVGVVTSDGRGTTADELIRRADELMYQAKHGGKNTLQQAVLAAG